MAENVKMKDVPNPRPNISSPVAVTTIDACIDGASV